MSITHVVYGVRATLIDGGNVDLILFAEKAAAEEHAAYVRASCKLLGFRSLTVIERRIIGKEFVPKKEQAEV